MTCIVANGNWCGYTKEAKEHGEQTGVGVFFLGEVNGMLYSSNPNGYAQKDNEGRPVYAYRSA